MTKFHPGQSAQQAHTALKSSLQTMEKAKQCALLWFGDILERQLYRALGYSSINQYAEVELGFSKTRTGDFLSLCRKLEELPKVKKNVASGRLGYTAARVLVAVRVTMEMSPTQFARYEALLAKARKQGDLPSDKVEALLEMMAGFTAQSSPRGELTPAPQVHIHQCPDCEKATVQTSRGELEIAPSEHERALCDCRISVPGQRNTTAIPPSTRRFVLARDRHKCQRPGCHHTQFLEVHHKVSRARGGSNEADNLTTVCGACHRLLHENGVGIVRSPEIVYRWVGDAHLV